MWIERIEFAGFGSLANQKIEFSKSLLNLVVEPNEYGKSTIAEAIWAVLFDYPARSKTTADKLKEREARQPASGGPFKACLDISGKDRSLRIVRDFGARTIRVFDRDKGDVEVTPEFLTGPNTDEVGYKLVGMGRDLFKNTCFVGQGDLDTNALSEVENLSSLLQSLADSSGAATTSATAVSVIESALGQFPYQGIKMRVDKLLKQLEDDRQRLQALTDRLSAEYDGVRSELAGLSELEKEIDRQESRHLAGEYFQLCMEAADVDSRLMKAQERVLQVNELKTQMVKLAEYRQFPVDRVQSVEELWTRRQSRQSDYKRTEIELKLKEKQLQARELEVREKWEGVAKCAVEDAQTLSSLARTFVEVKSDLSDSRRKSDEEGVRVKELGIDLEKLSGLRTALRNLDARDQDNANAYNAMINAAQDQIKECQGTVWRARQIMPEIEEQRRLKVGSCRNNFMILGFLVGTVAVFEAAMFFIQRVQLANPLAWGGLIILVALSGFGLFNGVLYAQAKAHREKDWQQARDDEQKFSEKGVELHNKIMGLEIKLDDLARKACVSSGAELMKYIQAYGTAGSQLKDLDLIEQIIDSREAHIVKLVAQIEPYFQKAGRNVAEITPEEAFKLADNINQFLDESRAVKASYSSLEHYQSELKFLADELKDIDARLKEHFSLAGLANPDDSETAYKQFAAAEAEYRQWESLQKELSRMEKDTISDLPVGELPKVVQKLESQRKSIWGRIEAIIARCPGIAQLNPGDSRPLAQDIDPESANRLAEMKKRREELTIKLRAATKEYDEKYLPAAEELEDLDSDIYKVRRAKTALELARDTFQRLSEETHLNWSNRLNEISKEMLQSLNTEFESLHFAPDLRLTARRKGESEPIQPNQINSQASGGVKDQLHWLARMAVARYLAEQAALPIIMDEPFSESDDERFLGTMRFLLDNMLGKHQLILFSCHQRRHEWMLEQLSEKQRGLIKQCRLEPLATLSDVTK